MIGPTFVEELKAKEQATGLTLLVEGVSWGDPRSGGGLDSLPVGLTPVQIQAITEVVAAHDPTKPSKGKITEQNKATAKANLLAHCELIEADTTLPLNVKKLAILLKQVIQ